MSNAIQQYKSVLRASNHSVTSARLTVFQALLTHGAQTMRQLSAHCTDLDRSTVYRVVELLEYIGVVQRLQIGWKYQLELSDAFTEHHHHISCVACGQIIDIHEDTALESQLAAFAAAAGFIMTDHQLEIRGRCRDCQNQLQTNV